MEDGAHHGRRAHLRNSYDNRRSETEPSPAHALLCLVFPAVPRDTYRDERLGIRITKRIGSHLLNSRRMQSLTGLSTTTVHDLLFVNDRALNTATEADMQRSMDLFASGCAKFGLTANTDKTVLTFKERLNGVFMDIQFTMVEEEKGEEEEEEKEEEEEEEQNSQLAYLYVLVCRKDCGGLKAK
nr:unnamed protein product [Spirometra erinaceieuropaei]